MSSHLESGTWTDDGRDLLSGPVLNFFARRRIIISLIGFLACITFNLCWLHTIPLNPFALWDWPVAIAWFLLLSGLAIRSWSAGTLDKSRSLTQTGPYALTRNPLYVGSFLVMAGYCILLRDVPSTLFVMGPLAMLYCLQIHFEEKRLLFLFPREWPAYAARVPRCLPRPAPLQSLGGWTWFEWKRNREYRSLLTALAGTVAVYAWHVASQRVWL